MPPFLLTAPAIEPVALTDIKAWLRIDSTAEDDAINALLLAARQLIESVTRRKLITQSWRFVLEAFPQDNILRIPFAPFQSVLAMRVYDVNNVATPLAPALWTLDANPEAARLLFTTAPPAPGRAIAGIEIDVMLGYGATPTAVPEPIRQAIRMLAARWYENRGDGEADSGATHLPAAVAALLTPYIRRRLA